MELEFLMYLDTLYMSRCAKFDHIVVLVLINYKLGYTCIVTHMRDRHICNT